jgi:hypothetical protein
MLGSLRAPLLATTLMAVLVAFTSPALTQEKPADTMELLRQKLKADKKLVVGANMDLTESEAQRFWPVYEDYQRDLQKLNQRIIALIERYAADYRNQSLTDEKAKPLIDEAVSIEQAEAKLKRAYVPKLSKVLPAKKVARYMQIENKIRAIVKYDLAGGVPLVQ